MGRLDIYDIILSASLETAFCLTHGSASQCDVHPCPGPCLPRYWARPSVQVSESAEVKKSLASAIFRLSECTSSTRGANGTEQTIRNVELDIWYSTIGHGLPAHSVSGPLRPNNVHKSDPAYPSTILLMHDWKQNTT